MGRVQLLDVSNHQIKMQLLGHSRIWPRSCRQLCDLLKSKARLTLESEKVEPVLTRDVFLTHTRGLMTLTVRKTKK